MAVYAIGDLHLSLGCNKPMDVFSGWQDYVSRIETNWKAAVQPEDTVVLAGDITWGMSLEEALPDFKWIDSLPGQKVILKGNHDYWWNTQAKTERFWVENQLSSLSLLHNSFVLADGLALCGTRGWMNEPNATHDLKIMAREVGRLRLSLENAKRNVPEAERVVFLHYPPVFPGSVFEDLVGVLHEYNVKRCYYGHLHGQTIKRAVQGTVGDIIYRLISADALFFTPIKISG